MDAEDGRAPFERQGVRGGRHPVVGVERQPPHLDGDLGPVGALVIEVRLIAVLRLELVVGLLVRGHRGPT